jgi:ABC-2 type transport system permease protein
MRETWLLGRRAIAEIWKLPAATVPTLFIPLFFLAVNIGQVSKTFPNTTPFLHGQNYAAFQLPITLVFATSTATSGLALVTDIDGGYLDKLLLAPIRRSSIVLGHLVADFARGLMVSLLVLALGLAFGVRIKAGIPGAVVLVLLASLWGVAYAGFAQFIALKTRNVQTTNASFIIFFPLLFLTPNFVPFELLQQPMRALARGNPVSYIIVGLRSLVLEGWNSGQLLACAAAIVITGVVLTALSLQTLKTFGD